MEEASPPPQSSESQPTYGGDDIWDGPDVDQLVPGGYQEGSILESLAAPEPVEEPASTIPDLEQLIEKIPESNRKLLKELLGGDFREVRRLKPASRN